MSAIWGYYTTVAKNRQQIENYLSYWNLAYGQDIQQSQRIHKLTLGCCHNSIVTTPPPDKLVISKGNRHYILDVIIYNRCDLLESLPCLNQNISDEELFVEYIEQYSLSHLSNINGDFAGAVFDSDTSSITLFRDHIGIRPLFYYADSETLVFSTDIRGIISLPFIEAKVNPKWLFQMMNGYITSTPSDTEIDGIHVIHPASYTTYRVDDSIQKVVSNTYWKLGKSKIRMNSEKAYQDHLRMLITDSVQKRLDRFPGIVGSELSGGLDSGVISILINRLDHCALYHSWSQDPSLVSYVENDERYIINDICDQENIHCHYSHSTLPRELTKNTTQYMQETMGIDSDPNLSPVVTLDLPVYINTLTMCEAAAYMSSNGAKVIFSGHGGDEGVSHRSVPYEMFANKEYYHFLRYMYSTTHGKKRRILTTLSKMRKTITDGKKQQKQMYQFIYHAPDMLSKEMKHSFSKNEMTQNFFFVSPIDYVLSGGSRNRLDVSALLGAFSGAQYVFPYMDYRVLNYAVSIPRYLFLKGHRNRYIFREAFKDILPKSLYTLRRKSEASIPQDPDGTDWFISFDNQRKNTVSLLNREFWKDLLDFEAIDKWLSEGQPCDEDKSRFIGIDYCLFQCAILENEICKTKLITEQHFK